MNIRYTASDSVAVDEFIELANAVWPKDYDRQKVLAALAVTDCITARDDGRLVGCLRILSDGYLFSTIPEAFVHPDYQRQGIGSELFERAKQHCPTSFFFGAQAGLNAFYERLGFEKSLQSFHYKK